LQQYIFCDALRAGYATSAAARNMPAYRIQSHTRHKSAEVLAGYIREADKWNKLGSPACLTRNNSMAAR
jgi:hypothetical protein